ncbi:MAG: AsmA family protein [Candidatus Sulfotelmatobacter sp.]
MKRILKIIAIVVAVLIIILIAIPFFIDANTFRPKLETELSSTLGRQVKVGNLSLSLFSGAVSADDISIADDAAFSKTPFVQAKSLSVGVEMIPLIFSKMLNVTHITLNQPQIALVKSEDGEKWNFSSLGNSSAPAPAQTAPAEAKPAEQKPVEQPAAGSSSSSANPNLSVAKLNVKDGQVTISQAGSMEKPKVYDKVNITVTNFSFTSSFPFTMSADLPGGGTLNLDGNAGPINATDAATTPLNAKVVVKSMNLAQSGFIDPASGIAGMADFDGTVTSDGHEAKTNGTLKVANLKVAEKGSPAGKPVEITYAVVYDLKKQNGSIGQGDVAMGKAVAHLTGTYDAHGKVTSVNMKLSGDGMPVDDLEAMLPALGVVLPPKATLKGGDLNVNVTIVGPVDKLVTAGTVRMQNTELANFDLGSKLSSISALSGKQTGNDTSIKNFSSEVRVAPEGTQANNINLDVPSIGVVTGGGTVSPSNQLAFKMNASVGGLGVPFAVGGTTSDPKFTPDVKGMATGLLKNALGGKAGSQNPLGGLSGMFKKKPK